VQDINPKPPIEKPVPPVPIVSKPMVNVTSYRLNLRERGSSKSKILSILKKGDVLEVLSKKGKWVQVRNKAGLSGWVYNRYIKPTNGEAIEKTSDIKIKKKIKVRQNEKMKIKKSPSITPAKAVVAHQSEKTVKPPAEKQSGSNGSKKIIEEKLEPSQASPGQQNQSIFDTPIKKAVEKMLLASGDDHILKATNHIASSVLGDFATSNVSYELNGKKAKMKVYLYKENEHWIASRKIPTHFDHHGVFLMMAREYCIDRWPYFNGIGYLDNSWKNKDPHKRIINFNCRVVENNEWRDNHLKFTYEYNPSRGWHIIEVFDLYANEKSGKQSGVVAQIKKPLDGSKKTSTQIEEVAFSDQVVDRFFISILGGDIEAVKGFLDAGMSPNVKRPRLGHSPLFTSVIGHRDKIAMLLIKKGADVNFRDENQSAPLIWAAENCKSVKLVRALIDAGAYVNARAKGGGTPLMGAVDNHCDEIVRILREAGAN
jgi:hypothetical protein